MIAAETLLALYPQPPRVATTWDFMLPRRSSRTPWQDKGVEEILRDLEEAIRSIPDVVPQPYEPAHYHAIHTPWQREAAESDLLYVASCTLPSAEAREFVRRASACNRLREAEHYAKQGVIIDLTPRPDLDL